MGKNIVEKILQSHIVEGKPVAGEEVGIRIDQTLTQDATGTMACLQFEAMGFERVKTEVSVSYADHNTIQEGFENPDDHAYLRTIAAKYGMLFSKPGNGICHQVHLERFGAPGKTLLGADSHTPTGGGIGMIAIGAGGLDVAVAMGGGPFYMTYPRVIKVELTGKLRPWVSAKDVILKVLEIISTKGNVGCVLEYSGEGIAALSVPERATITNMGAETGVTTSVFPSDTQTKRFLDAQGRGEQWQNLTADPDAAYDRVITIDLSTLEPMVACPHSPGNVKRVKELAGQKVDQVLIGSCTNGSYRDIMTVAAALKGRRVADDLSFAVVCGSRQVLEMVSRNGALADIVAAGARVLESACGFCIGNSMAPKSDAVSVRTNNRNFFGRSGTQSAGIYLVSPETAVACALNGLFTDPTEVFDAAAYPAVDVPEHFTIDDSMVLQPSSTPQKVEIARGPNIGDPPAGKAFPEALRGVVAIKVGDKITTDHIMPAGNRLKYRSNIPAYAKFVFEREDPDFAQRALAIRDKGEHNIIIAGESYGQGSSREHAAICPGYLGVRAVVAKSMERIARANLINFGILPAAFADPADYDAIAAGDELTAEDARASVSRGNELTVRNQTKGTAFTVQFDLSKREREMLLAGGLINRMREG